MGDLSIQDLMVEYTSGTDIIRPIDGFDLGTVPMSRAFASSCNTTFAELASRMPPRGLTTAATIYLGWHYVLDDLAGLVFPGSPERVFRRQIDVFRIMTKCNFRSGSSSGRQQLKTSRIEGLGQLQQNS